MSQFNAMVDGNRKKLCCMKPYTLCNLHIHIIDTPFRGQIGVGLVYEFNEVCNGQTVGSQLSKQDYFRDFLKSEWVPPEHIWDK